MIYRMVHVLEDALQTVTPFTICVFITGYSSALWQTRGGKVLTMKFVFG